MILLLYVYVLLHRTKKKRKEIKKKSNKHIISARGYGYNRETGDIAVSCVCIYGYICCLYL